MKKISRKVLWEILAVLMLGLIPLLWFKKGYVIAGSDVSYPFEPVNFFLKRFYLWNDISDLGSSASWNAPSLFFHGLEAFFSFLGFSLEAVQKLSRVFWFTLSCLSMYFFAGVITKNKAGSLQKLSMVIFYAFSPFLFNVWEGNAGVICALAAVPFMLGMLILGLEKRMPPLKTAAVMSLVSIVFCEIGVAPSIFLIPVIVCGFYFIFYLASQCFYERNIKQILFSLNFFILFWVAYFLVNIFWWAPYGYEIFSKLNLSPDNPLAAFNMANWLNDISIHTSLLNISRFQGAWDWYYCWGDVPYVQYAGNFFKNPALLFLGALMPIFAYSAVLLRKKDKQVLFFALMALVAAFFSAGTHRPTGLVFAWLVKKIPVFLAFRSPYYKFGLIMLFAYAYLMSVSIYEIYKRLKSSRMAQEKKFIFKYFNENLRRKMPLITVIGILLGFFIYNYPMLTGDIIPLRTKVTSLHVKIPDYVFRAADWLAEDKSFNRIIALPRSNTDNYKWGYGSPTNLMYLFAKTSIVWPGAFSAANEPRDIFYENFYADNFYNLSEILKLLSIKYVWLAGDSWHKLIYGEDDPGTEILKERLLLQKGIKFEKKIGWWQFFKVENTSEPIFAAKAVNLAIADCKSLVPYLLTNKTGSVPVVIFFALNSSSTADKLMSENKVDTLIAYNNSLADDTVYSQYLNKDDVSFKSLFSSLNMPRFLNAQPQDKPPVSLKKITGLINSDELENDEDWQWLLSTNMLPNLIIDNSALHVVETNLSLTVYSYKRERRFYIYVNGDLRQHLMIEAEKPSEVILEKIKLRPGENYIAFYTPYQSDKRNGQEVTFALKDIKIGSFILKTDVFIPKKGDYKIHFFPYPQAKIVNKQVDFNGNKIVKLDNKEINFTAENMSYQKEGVFLEKGMHTIEFSQEETLEYYVCFELQGAKQEKVDLPEVFFTKINPAKYRLRIKASQPYILVFNEAFHPDWKAYIDGREVTEHFSANGYANAWLIKKSGLYEVVLEFWPQRLFVAAGLISLSVCGFFIIALIRGKNK